MRPRMGMETEIFSGIDGATTGSADPHVHSLWRKGKVSRYSGAAPLGHKFPGLQGRRDEQLFHWKAAGLPSGECVVGTQAANRTSIDSFSSGPTLHFINL